MDADGHVVPVGGGEEHGHSHTHGPDCGHHHASPAVPAEAEAREASSDIVADVYGLRGPGAGSAKIREDPSGGLPSAGEASEKSAAAGSGTSGARGEKALTERVGSPDEEDVAAMRQVLRSKGYLWLDTMPDFNVFWSQAGKHVKVEAGGPWWAAVPRERWPKGAVKDILDDFVEPFGDRETELVVIGHSMDKSKVEAALQKCLLTEEELKEGIEGWEKHDDPMMEGVLRSVLARQLAAWEFEDEDEDEDEVASESDADAPKEAEDED